VPIGQGLAATPLQVATLYATLANGGKRIDPHLVSRIDGPADLAPEPESQRIVSKQTARQIGRMLERVVTTGSGTLAQVAGYRVAGKTGTSAKVEPNGTYSTRRYVASFVGFVPARDPQVVVLVTVDEPKQNIFGGKVAAPAFAEITEFAVKHLEIPPNTNRARR
jgi:cell division protein FtsI (penicillin-binding protein 3)